MKIINERIIQVSEMEEGDIARIVEWGILTMHINKIVVRKGNGLYYTDDSDRWSSLFTQPDLSTRSVLKVELIK